jgi:hypothetical protein
VRKSLNFCKTLNMEIVGIVENMSGYICPHCGETTDIFSSGGGEKTARDFDLPFLGKVPMDPRVVIAGDTGTPYLSSGEDTPAVQAFSKVVSQVADRLPPGPVPVSLNTVSNEDSGCGCGSSGCNPNSCDC